MQMNELSHVQIKLFKGLSGWPDGGPWILVTNSFPKTPIYIYFNLS